MVSETADAANKNGEGIETIEQRLNRIEERNTRVEGEKAWERSFVRIILTAVMVYGFAVLYLLLADTTNPFYGAVVPAVGFLISMQSLKLIKNTWLKRRGCKKNSTK